MASTSPNEFFVWVQSKTCKKNILKIFDKTKEIRSKLIHDDAIRYKYFVACEIWKK
jgi:hypothetical protein